MLLRMEPIHPLSSVAPLSTFDLWGVPPTLVSINSHREHHIYPLAVINGNSPIIFNINSSIDEYIKLDSLNLYTVFRLHLEKQVKSDPKETDWKSIKIANYGMHAIFKQLEMEINGLSVSNANQNYPYIACFEALLGFSQDGKKSHLSGKL